MLYISGLQPGRSTPHELTYGRRPNVAPLRISGCRRTIPMIHINSVDDGKDLISAEFDDEGSRWSVTKTGDYEGQPILGTPSSN